MSPGFLASMSASRGSTSPRMKSSAVFFIISCSSFSISGVKIVADPVASSKKPPPGDSVISEFAMFRVYHFTQVRTWHTLK